MFPDWPPDVSVETTVILDRHHINHMRSPVRASRRHHQDDAGAEVTGRLQRDVAVWAPVLVDRNPVVTHADVELDGVAPRRDVVDDGLEIAAAVGVQVQGPYVEDLGGG